MVHQIALASVVTSSFMEEFLLLKFSCELLHHQQFQWYVRCDEASAALLSKEANITATPFCSSSLTRNSPGEKEFNRIALQKAESIADAWNAGLCTSVAFLDADLIVTSAFLSDFEMFDTDLILTPNHHAPGNEVFEPFHGFFNSGFVLTKNCKFHEKWKAHLSSRSWQFSDQVCFNDLCAEFSVTQLTSLANIGFWHSRNARIFNFEPIPPNCCLLHAHCFHPITDGRGWVDRMFAFHCLRFLHTST